MASVAYEGGIGGKFRKRPFRRAPSTPYDRPPTAARALRSNHPVEAAAADGRNGWLSKLVDPASRLITKGASRLFSSVFRKRLGAPPAPPEANLESRQEVHDVVSTNPFPEVQEEKANDEDNSRNNSNDDRISELEQLLKEKTFTRDEFDRLTELLRSRTVSFSEEDKKKSIEPSTSHPAAGHEKQEIPLVSAQGNAIGCSKVFESILTPGVSLNIPEEEIASPAELAKAYMGSRPLKVSPSNLSLRNKAIREAMPSHNVIPFTPKPFDASITPRSVVRFSGVSGLTDNEYLTPRPRGRSAIYKMSRSPYFKGHTTPKLKGVEPANSGYSGPSTSAQWTPISLAPSSGKQALKRRSSALDSDLGSFGPLRRIRQKSSLMSSSKDKPLLLHEVKHDPSILRDAGTEGNRISCVGFGSVPSRSSDMARKILQQLDKLVPSPKEKSSDVKAIARDESPSKLTPGTLSGRALKSVADINPSNLFNVQADGSRPASEVNGMANTLISVTYTSKPGMGASGSVFLGSSAAPPQNKPAFQMQAPEDSLEMDGDGYSRRVASGASPTGKENLESQTLEHDSFISETTFSRKPFTFSFKSKPSSTYPSSKEEKMGGNDGLIVDGKDTAFNFQVPSSPSTLVQPPQTPIMPSPVIDKSAQSKEQIAAPVFGFGSKSTPMLTFSSNATSFTDPTGLKFSAKSDPEVQLSRSVSCSRSTIETLMPTTPVEITNSDNGDKTQKAADLFKAVGSTISSSSSASTTQSIFTFAASTTSSQNNCSLKSTSSLLSASGDPATSLSGSSVSPNISNSSVTSSSFSGAPVSITASTCPTLPSFQFKPSDLSSAFGQRSTMPFTASVAGSSSSPNSSLSAPPATASGLFDSSSQPGMSSIFGCGFGSTISSPSMGFSLGSSPSSSVTAPLSFGSSSGSVFSFTSAATTSSSAPLSPVVPAFGMSSQAVSFSSASLANDGMNVEDGMADDTVQSTMLTIPAFGQTANVSAPSNLAFGSPALPSGGGLVFQFSSPQASPFPPQSQSLFQASGNFSPGGSFSLGSGGTDKAGRRFIKVKRDKHRKK